MRQKRFIPSLFHSIGFHVVLGLSLIVLGLGFSCSGAKKKKPLNLDDTPSPPQAEHAFYYKHTGPRPWSDGSQDCSGGRLVIVMEKNAESGNLWPIEEHFEKIQGAQIGYYDDKYRLHRQTLQADGSEWLVQFTPPITVRYLDIHRDGEKTYSSVQTIYDSANRETAIGTSKLTVKTKRAYDERIVTPAGAFLCRHLKSQIRIETAGQDSTNVFGATIDSYWCDRIGWFVQETYTFDPVTQNGIVIQPGYNANSTLNRFKPDDYTPPHPQ